MTTKKATSAADKKAAPKKTAAKKPVKKEDNKVREKEDNGLNISPERFREEQEAEQIGVVGNPPNLDKFKVPKKAKPEPADKDKTEEEEKPADRRPETGGDATITVVIPFKASVAKGNELQFAIRAWDKHLPGVKIVVIGDSLPWFGDELIHIEHKAKSDNPQIDVAQKMMVAIASDEVSDIFVWSNDDIYPVSNIMFSDIEVLKAMGRLGRKGTPGSIYSKNGDRTLAALKKLKIQEPWDFATHTPMVLLKNELAEVITQFNCDKEGHLIYTLYANTRYKGFNPIQVDNGARGSIVASVYRADPNKNVLDKAFKERKFINNNDAGWKAVIPYLKELFPDKSRFEK